MKPVGIGAALSNLAIGFLVKATGFAIGFFALSAIAAIDMVWLWLMMPETKESHSAACLAISHRKSLGLLNQMKPPRQNGLKKQF